MSFFEELRRRNVVRMAVLYAVSSWLILQVADLLFDLMGLPTEWLRLVLALLILGFPLALIFSWIYEITPEGIKRDKDVDHSQAVASTTGHKINVLIAILLVLAIASVVVDRLIPEAPTPDADVRTEAEPVAGDDATAMAGAKFAPPPERSIAVLPFVSMSSEADNEFFADGLSEEILNFLADVTDLRVTARTSSFQFKGRNLDVREVAKALSVAHVLEGSVRRSGSRARITAQLIRAEDGYHLWSETYDRTMEDTFEIQTDIAESVTRALGVVMDEQQRARMHEVGVKDVEAFIYYQRGKQKYYDAHSNRIDMDMLAESAELLSEAIRREPRFASAYHLRSDLHAHTMTMLGVADEERVVAYEAFVRDVSAASEHARSADARGLYEVDHVLASSSWRTLPNVFAAALASTTCDPGAWVEVAPSFGFAEQSLARNLRLIECDPLNFYNYYAAAFDLVWAGRAAEALDMVARGLEVTPDDPFLDGLAVKALLVQGRVDEALDRAQTIRSWAYDMSVAAAAAAKGDQQRAVEAAARAVAASGPWQKMYMKLQLAAITGDTAAANQAAAWYDGLPGGQLMLAGAVQECMCGALFDLEVAPGFAARLEEGGFDWPPPKFIDYPAMRD